MSTCNSYKLFRFGLIMNIMISKRVFLKIICCVHNAKIYRDYIWLTRDSSYNYSADQLFWYVKELHNSHTSHLHWMLRDSKNSFVGRTCMLHAKEYEIAYDVKGFRNSSLEHLLLKARVFSDSSRSITHIYINVKLTDSLIAM